MTAILDRPQVETIPDESVALDEKIKEWARTAAQRIERGWGKRRLWRCLDEYNGAFNKFAGRGDVCLVGALSFAYSGDPMRPGDRTNFIDDAPEYARLLDVVRDRLIRERPDDYWGAAYSTAAEALEAFNDSPPRTRDEVLAVLRAVAGDPS